MTLRKSVTVVLVLVAVVTLGALAWPRLMNRTAEAPAATPPVTASEPATPAAAPSRPSAPPRAESTRNAPEVAPTTPELQKCLDPCIQMLRGGDGCGCRRSILHLGQNAKRQWLAQAQHCSGLIDQPRE